MLDLHEAITVKERSSRYIRIAFAYFRKVLGEDKYTLLLEDLMITEQSSIYQHISNDENWNSYALEIYIFETMVDYFEDPYQSFWQIGVASGSGEFDKQSNLTGFLVKVAPVLTIIKKLSIQAERFSLISETSAEKLKSSFHRGMLHKAGIATFNYSKLPVEYQHPHWTSIVAGFGIIYGVLNYRKGLSANVDIIAWPLLPSVLPNFQGKKYIEKNGNILEADSRLLIGKTSDNNITIDGVNFSAGLIAKARFQWIPESFIIKLRKNTISRSKIKSEQKEKTLRKQILSEVNEEHQSQLARFKHELSEKTKIIEEKMQQIQNLKEQQDGDYFLTSVLTEPLIVNQNKSTRVETQFLIKQKKKFRFRKYRAELGGDICISDNVIINDKKYTAFVNGDAMGKSMQGAGGSLIMGVVFHAYLARSKHLQSKYSKSPELWLRDVYFELQNVFVTFDGSMYISATIGLIDDELGILYYINAEHPFTILYRDKKATFIESEMSLRKVGVAEQEFPLQVKVFQLQSEDTIFIGSDGKDDLEIIANNKRIINENEKLILQCIEKSKGDLKNLYRAIRRKGKILDDISIIKIIYSQPLEQSSLAKLSDAKLKKVKVQQNPYLTQELCQRLIKTKDFKAAYQQHNIMKNCDSVDNQFLEFLSKQYHNENNVEAAIHIAEKIALREPTNITNLILLADSYKTLHQNNKALAAITQALEIDPDKSEALVIKDALSIVN